MGNIHGQYCNKLTFYSETHLCIVFVETYFENYLPLNKLLTPTISGQHTSQRVSSFGLTYSLPNVSQQSCTVYSGRQTSTKLLVYYFRGRLLGLLPSITLPTVQHNIRSWIDITLHQMNSEIL